MVRKSRYAGIANLQSAGLIPLSGSDSVGLSSSTQTPAMELEGLDDDMMPYKIVDVTREKRFGIVANSLESLTSRGE